MRVLVAPDKFRGTLTAGEAARAIETGWLRERPSDMIDLAPMADGGEGTLETLIDALGGEIVTHRVRGPLGDELDAPFGIAQEIPGSLSSPATTICRRRSNMRSVPDCGSAFR